MIKRILNLLWAAALLLNVANARAFYNPTTGRWLSRDPAGEYDIRSLYAFVANNPVLSVDGDGRLTITLKSPAAITPCGGWADGQWLYRVDPNQVAVYLIQKITLTERFHMNCSLTKRNFIKTDSTFFEARKVEVPPPGKQFGFVDHDSHGGHGSSTFGYHSVTAEAKVIDAKSHPEIDTWPTNDPRAPGMHTTSTVSWWDSVSALESASRSSYRDWSCCCSKVEGPWVHNP